MDDEARRKEIEQNSIPEGPRWLWDWKWWFGIIFMSLLLVWIRTRH